MSKLKRVISVCILLVILILLYTFSYLSYDAIKSEKVSVDTKETQLKSIEETNALNRRTSYKMEVPIIMQYPQLPSGCEITSLTMVLNYLGFSVDKETMANDYLIYGSSFVTEYSGSVRDVYGGMCYAPCITRTANKFLHKNKSDLRAKDITGCTIDELLKYIDRDIPVVVWNTVDLSSPTYTGVSEIFNNREYYPFPEEHCVVLSGYDKNTQELIINDPLKGVVKRDWKTFESIYNQCEKNCVVIE